jgi:hypothetical protein
MPKLKPPKDEVHCPKCGSLLDMDIWCSATRSYLKGWGDYLELSAEDTEYNASEVVAWRCSKFECDYKFTTPRAVASLKDTFKKIMAEVDHIPLLPNEAEPEL